MRLAPGQEAPPFSAESVVENKQLALEQFAGRSLLLMFHRYAGCPMCNIRLHQFAMQYPLLRAKGLAAVAFFHSPPSEIRKHAGGRQYPFEIAADPKFRVYRKYGVETSWPRLALALVQPKVYATAARAFIQGFRGGRMPKQLAKMPADFVIRPDGVIHIAHYGQRINDSLSIVEIAAALDEVSR